MGRWSGGARARGLAVGLGLAPGAAWAGACEDVGAMLASGRPEAEVVEELRRADLRLSADELSCVEGRGAPAAVLAELRGRVAAPAGPALPPGIDPEAVRAIWRAEQLRMDAALPDPHLAVGLSATFAFGSGHFAAGRPGAGTCFLVTQLLGTVLVATAPALGEAAAWSGVAVLAASRVAEPITLAKGLRKERQAWLESGGAR